MRASIQEAYEEYVAELTRYREWIDEMARKYQQQKPNHWEWGDHDFEKARNWNSALGAIRSVLGMTDEEDAEADRRAGIKRYAVNPAGEHQRA